MIPTRVFIHGLESSSGGTKGRFFRERFPDMIVEDFLGTFSQRLEKLETLLAGKSPLLLVGSSFGGLMATVYAGRHPLEVKKLILLAPALHLEPYRMHLPKKLFMPVRIYHGTNDVVVPLHPVRAIAMKICADLVFQEVEDDHVLKATFPSLPWEELLVLS